MKKSKVYFTNARSLHYRYIYSLPSKLKRLMDVANLKEFTPANRKTAVKTHFGTIGAFRIVRPRFLRLIVEAVKEADAQPFVTDTGGFEKLGYAVMNGITELSVGAPVLLAGGVKDLDCVLCKTGGSLVPEIGVAGAIYDADSMVVVSHSKGHIQSGYGGAIKNVAMGCVATKTRDGLIQRGQMHARGEAPFTLDEQKCTLCGQCVEVCSYVSKALKIEEEKLILDKNKCWRCGRCVRVCPTGALSVDLDEESFAQGMAEAMNAVVSTFDPGRIIYINFILEFQPECDCMPMADTPIIQDQGILMSHDPVAIDAATLDLVGGAVPLAQSRAEEHNVSSGGPEFLKNAIGRDPWHQVVCAEKMGLGTRQYELVQIEP